MTEQEFHQKIKDTQSFRWKSVSSWLNNDLCIDKLFTPFGEQFYLVTETELDTLMLGEKDD